MGQAEGVARFLSEVARILAVAYIGGLTINSIGNGVVDLDREQRYFLNRLEVFISFSVIFL